MVGVASELEEPVDDGAEGGPGVRGAGGAEGGSVEFDGAIEVL